MFSAGLGFLGWQHIYFPILKTLGKTILKTEKKNARAFENCKAISYIKNAAIIKITRTPFYI